MTLKITEPWNVHKFVSNIEGWDPITHDGTEGPASSADAVIADGEAGGITIEREV